MKSIYLGKINGVETVAIVTMEKPVHHQYLSPSNWIAERNKYEQHLAAAQKHEVIGNIPNDWVVWSEVDVELQHQARNTIELSFNDCSEDYYNKVVDHHNLKRIVAKPLPKTVKCDYCGYYFGTHEERCKYKDKPLPVDPECLHPDCDCADNFCKVWNKPLPVVMTDKDVCELCGDTGLMTDGDFDTPCDKCQPTWEENELQKLAANISIKAVAKALEQETDEEVDMVNIDFVVWYSGIDKIEIINAYSRWVKETYPEINHP